MEKKLPIDHALIPLFAISFYKSNLGYLRRDICDSIKELKYEKLVMTCNSVKFFQKNISWKIVTGLIPNKFRPKKILK